MIRTLELASCLPQSEVFTHGGGHMVPSCSGDFKRTLLDFVGRHSEGS